MSKEEPIGDKIRVRRIKDACCGMEDGKTYEAITSCREHPNYVRVKLPDGTWTDSHWTPGYFEVLK